MQKFVKDRHQQKTLELLSPQLGVLVEEGGAGSCCAPLPPSVPLPAP